MRRGVRLGIDVGGVRIGVAASDPSGLVATPVETVRRGPGDLEHLGALATEHEAVEIVVGLPRSMSGAEGHAAAAVRAFAGALAATMPRIPVRLVDERLSTVTALRDIRASGVSGRRGRATRRTVVDQAAAVVILQSALDEERGTGRPPGQPVEPRDARENSGGGAGKEDG